MSKPKSAGRRFDPQGRRKRVENPFLEARLRERFGLTRRQAEVAAALADGLSYAEIAERLGVSYHTVHTHIKAIHQKAGVSTTGRLAALLYGARKSSK